MIDEREKQEIINAAVEKALLMLPEVVGNLLASRAAMSSLTSAFYAKHPEFRDHKEAVASVVEMVEGRYPGMPYGELLHKALPDIRQRIAVTSGLNTTTVSTTPDRHLPALKDLDPLGSPHGDV
jgi:hypothetical protein